MRLSTVSYSVPIRLQMELLSPLAAVAERFKEKYRTLATAVDTTRHELPVQAIHMQGSGQELLGRNKSFAVCHCHSRKEPEGPHVSYPRCLHSEVVLEPMSSPVVRT